MYKPTFNSVDYCLVLMRSVVSVLFFYYFQISNLDIMHAVVALYDVSLSEMTPDVLYSAVCNKYAKTIVLMRDVEGEK